MSNEAIIDAIAERLARGRLHAHDGPVWNAPAPAAAPSETVPAPFSLAERQTRRSTAVFRMSLPPDDSPTFPSDVDLTRQAGTLVAASSQGAPFCRMCAKG